MWHNDLNAIAKSTNLIGDDAYSQWVILSQDKNYFANSKTNFVQYESDDLRKTLNLVNKENASKKYLWTDNHTNIFAALK